MKRKQLKEEVVALLSEKFWAAKLLISETLTRVTAGVRSETSDINHFSLRTSRSGSGTHPYLFLISYFFYVCHT